MNLPSTAEANNHISDVVKCLPPAASPSELVLLVDCVVAEVVPRLCGRVGVAVSEWKRRFLQSQGQCAEVEDGDARDLVGSVINATDGDGRTAFHWAVSMKRFDVANVLLLPPFHAKALTVDSDGTSTLSTACSVDCPSDLLNTLIVQAFECGEQDGKDYFNSFDTAGNTALLYLASRGNTKGMKLLLGAIPSNTFLSFRNVDLKATGDSAPAAAGTVDTSAGSSEAALPPPTVDETPDVVQMKFPNPFALNKRRQSALHRAIARGSTDFVEEFLSWMKRRVVAENVGPSGIDTAGNKATVRHFINCQDILGNTALHYAAMENNQDLGQLLLRNGADRDIRNKDGQEFWRL